MTNLNLAPSLELKKQKLSDQEHQFCSNILNENHSFRSLGQDYYVDTTVEFVPGSRLVLFNKKLAQQLNLDLPESDQDIEKLILENCSWFKDDQNRNESTKDNKVKTFFSTRYQDSEDKSEGSALGDGRAIWVGEIINKGVSGQLQYLDLVLKGTGATSLAWVNHPRKSHRDGQVSINEAVHEYVYSAAAKKNGMSTVGVLAVIELPFIREVDNEKAAIVVRVGNHLRFAHYCYFSDNSIQLKALFDYGLKRDMGMSLSHKVTAKDVRQYLNFIATNLSADAAVYFDVHAVHGSPTFGNITSCGGTIDFATFVYTDAHHSNYSYMSDGANILGGEWGQTEQFFNLYSGLVSALKKSQFDYTVEIMPIEYFLKKFNNNFERVLTRRWLIRMGLSKQDIDLLSFKNKEFFYEIVKLIYELNGSKKIRFGKRKIFLAAFEPRNILSETFNYLDNFDDDTLIWEQLFKVNRKWGTYKRVDAKAYIGIYRKAVRNIVNELKATEEQVAIWQQQSKAIKLSERNEPGKDFFYDSERFNASEGVLKQIKLGDVTWNTISKTAENSAYNLADHGVVT